MNLNLFRPFLAFILFTGIYACDEIGETAKSETGKSEISTDSAKSEYTGLRVSNRKDGSVLSKVNYVEGQREGASQSYYENGKLQLEIAYHEGRKDGLEKYYYETGIIYRETKYEKGVLDSTQVFYHKNGTLMATVPYKQGNLCIGTKEFNDQGKELKPLEIETQIRDEVSLNSKYLVTLTMNKRVKEVEFFEVNDPENMPCPIYLNFLPTNQGKHVETFEISYGQIFMAKKIYFAKCTSFQRIPHAVKKSMTISVTNRG